MGFYESIILNNNFKVYQFITDTFDSNSYIIEYKDCLLMIDPGERLSSKVISWLTNNNRVLDYCLLTHEHFDHLIGYKNIINKFNAKTYCSDETKYAISNFRKNLSFYHNIPFEYNIKNRVYKLPNFIKVIKTPGHSKGSICVLLENCLFTGDTILENKKHITSKLPGGNRNELKESIDLINKLNNSLKLHIFPGHGEIFKCNNINLIS